MRSSTSRNPTFPATRFAHLNDLQADVLTSTVAVRARGRADHECHTVRPVVLDLDVFHIESNGDRQPIKSGTWRWAAKADLRRGFNPSRLVTVHAFSDNAWHGFSTETLVS